MPENLENSAVATGLEKVSFQNARLDEAQARIKIARRYINNLRYIDETTLMAESKEELKLLDEGETGEWESWL